MNKSNKISNRFTVHEFLSKDLASKNFKTKLEDGTRIRLFDASSIAEDIKWDPIKKEWVDDRWDFVCPDGTQFAKSNILEVKLTEEEANEARKFFKFHELGLDWVICHEKFAEENPELLEGYVCFGGQCAPDISEMMILVKKNDKCKMVKVNE